METFTTAPADFRPITFFYSHIIDIQPLESTNLRSRLLRSAVGYQRRSGMFCVLLQEQAEHPTENGASVVWLDHNYVENTKNTSEFLQDFETLKNVN